MISAVLLAAGESRRMGEFKQLLEFRGKSFVQRCVDNLIASNIEEIIVVTGHRESDVRRALADRPIKFAHNPDYPSGMSASIIAGVKAVSEKAAAVLIALVDQPQIEPQIIERIVAAYARQRPLIVVPTYEGRNGHPIILDLNLRGEILSLDPQAGLRQVVRAHEKDTLHVEVGSDAVLKDYDYPEDYRRLRDE